MSTTLRPHAAHAPTAVVRFHLSLNVDDLARSVAFFQILFDREPARREGDYAKFELDEPPLVLSLEPNRAPRGGKLNHLGFRLTDGDALVAMQKQLETHGIVTQREDGVECCYSRQTKFWLHDPDGNLWELYTLEGDLPHRGLGDHSAVSAPTAKPTSEQPAPAIWAHRLGEAFPTRILAESDGVDEVLLQGTFNERVSSGEARHILGEALRILKPGGRIVLHQLSARAPMAELPEPLPGPAAMVGAVPTADWLTGALESAGFVDIVFEKLSQAPCFTAGTVECRETRLAGFKPRAASGGLLTYEVLYKGPYREIVVDHAGKFQRGQWTNVDATTWERLQSTPQRDQFVLATSTGSC